MALGVWGASRATQDVDCLFLSDEKQRAALDKNLRRRRFVLDTQWSDRNPMLREWCARYWQGPFPVDLLSPRDEYDREALERRRRKRIDNKPVWVVGPEDLILLNLKAGRPRDFEDVISVVLRQGEKMDIEYMKEWAKRLGLWEELMYCLTQSEPPAV
jgi:predicted nucleotidyltransferase